MANNLKPESTACPVDSDTRAAWLQSRDGKKSVPFLESNSNAEALSLKKQDELKVTDQSSTLMSSTAPKMSLWESLTSWPAPPDERLRSSTLNKGNKLENQQTSNKTTWSSLTSTLSLGQDREISTIPRAKPPSSPTDKKVVNETERPPANCEIEGGVSSEGNWIYPSEKMFFDAMRRKGYTTEVADMKTIVPIHNAVNEQAWKEIKEWEKPWETDSCGGPKLHSFKGLSSSLTPKARLNTWLGYMAPFDRHDWIVDRCGKRVEYVIDFYVGKSRGTESRKLNFFLDVRPKLNTLEGCKMRAAKMLGIV